MAYLKISCAVCRRDWEVYGRDELGGKKARTCPHCDSRIDGKTWEEFILPALRAFDKANKELANDNVEYHTPLFQFDIYSDNFYRGGVYENGMGA